MKLTIDGAKFFQLVLSLEAERALRESDEAAAAGLCQVPPIVFHQPPNPEIELSILLPVWNPDRGQFLRCLRSLKGAELAGISFEVVVSDNASSTPVVKECLAEVGLDHVRYHCQPSNIGGFPNFNWCLAAARGQWLHLLSHDDWIAPKFYSSLLRGPAQNSGTDLRFCRSVIFDETSGTRRLMFDEAPTEGVLPDFVHRQAISQRIQIVGALFSRRTVETLGGFDPAIGASADWELWTRIASRFSTYYHPGQLATYVLHSASWSHREGNFEDADSFRKFRGLLIRILRHVPVEKRRAAAYGFMTNMCQRLLNVAVRNKRAAQLPNNHFVAEALMVGCKDAGLLPDVESVLASYN